MFFGSASEFFPAYVFFMLATPRDMRHPATYDQAAEMTHQRDFLKLARSARCDQSENGFETEWRDVPDRVIKFPYLVMFRNEHGHFVSVGGGSEFKTENEATAKAKEKCDELKTTVYSWRQSVVAHWPLNPS
jgi:hypothetical protein